jgi:hypothetical protein
MAIDLASTACMHDVIVPGHALAEELLRANYKEPARNLSPDGVFW